MVRIRKSLAAVIATLLVAPLSVVVLLPAANAGASTTPTTVVVDATGEAGWVNGSVCYDEGYDAVVPNYPSTKVTFANGPGTPPLGTGSLQLATGDGSSGATCSAALRNLNYDHVPLASLTSLSYSTYDSLNNGQQFPFLELHINFGEGGENADDTLFFEPPYQTPDTGSNACPDQGPTVMNEWQTWNALTGCWWSNNSSVGIPLGGEGNVAPLSALLSLHPGAYIVNSTDPSEGDVENQGGVSFVVGETADPDQFIGNVDNFTIGTTTSTTAYDFDPAPPCSTTCYVNSATGNDANSGSSLSTAKKTIQAALNQVSSGGTVIVAAGTYDESDTISSPVTLEGAQFGQPVGSRTSGGSAESTLTGAVLSGGVPVITVTAPNVTIDGFTIKDPVTSFSAIGIDLQGSASGATIENNILDGITNPDTSVNGTAQAIYLEDGPSNVNISSNEITNVSSYRAAKAISIGSNEDVVNSSNISIKGNEISNISSTARGAYGVLVGAGSSKTSNVQITGNSISGLSSGSGGWVHAIGVEGDAPSIAITGNTISGLSTTTGSPIAIWFENEDTAYGTATVNGNSLDVGETNGGIFVDPALSGGTVNGTCNWWGSASGPSGANSGSGSEVNAGVNFTPWLTSSNLSTATCDGKLPLSLNFGTAPSGVLYGATGVSVSATSSPSGIGTILYSTSSSACSVNSTSGAITTLGVGSCVVYANDSGNSLYAAATQVSTTFNIGASTALALHFGTAPSGVLYGATGVSVSATSSPSGIGTILYSTSSSACSVNSTSGAITTLGVGSCVVYANDSGNSLYVAATQVSTTFNIGASTALALHFGTAPSGVLYGATGVSVSATSSPSGIGTILYSTSSSACSVNSTSGAITTLGVGSCVVYANDSGNSLYAAATQVSTTFNIGSAKLTVTATNESKAFGAANPALAYSITGFVNGDHPAVVSGAPSCTTTATTTSAYGNYSISCTNGTLSALNYTFNFVPGTLSVGSTTCLSGTFNGYTVPNGASVCFGSGATINSYLNVGTGSSLDIEGAKVNGDIYSVKSNIVRICSATVSGPVTLTYDTGKVIVGDGSTCAGSKVSNAVTLTGDTGGSQVIGATISGPLTLSGDTNGETLNSNTVNNALTVQNSSGGLTTNSNTVSGPFTLESNSGGVTADSNNSTGSFTIQSNTGGITILSNYTKGNFTVESNSGSQNVSGNTAKGPIYIH